MSQSFRSISPALARRLRLVMTDVDGTIASGGEPAGPAVAQAVRRLENQGMTVGLVSGRTMPELVRMARDLSISGPIIAENGAVARLNAAAELLDLGHSRQPALEALKKLQKLYPGSVREREDNIDRIIDVVIFSDGIKPDEMRRHIGDVQLLDSGYIQHLMQAGINKGDTLIKLLKRLPEKRFSPDDTIVFGDSRTDVSLFERFPHAVLVPNLLLTDDHRRELVNTSQFVSDLPSERGFLEVISHILSLR